MPGNDSGPPEREEPGPTPETGPNQKSAGATQTNRCQRTTQRSAWGRDCGRSGAVVFDVDDPDKLPDVLRKHLAAAPFHVSTASIVSSFTSVV